MFEYRNGDIRVSRGDSAALTITFVGEVKDGTACLVTLKRDVGDTSPIWEKRMSVKDNQCRLSLTTDDTELDFETYFWDIRLIFNGYDVETVMEPHRFVIAEVVGNA